MKKSVIALSAAVIICMSGCSANSESSGNSAETTVFSSHNVKNQPMDSNSAAISTTENADTNNGSEISKEETEMSENNTPLVYMTTEITPESLMAIYEKLGFNAEGKVAVKISTGESEKSNHLSPELIKDLVQSVNGTIVECNTAYGGLRRRDKEYFYRYRLVRG